MYLPKVTTYPILAPFSWLYRLVIWSRNWLFEHGYKPTESFEDRVAVICVGNLAVGGTGKTPHTEYIVRLLQEHNIGPVAVLSRGYKRKTTGFLIANDSVTSSQIGDESYQFYRKFPDLIVAVDESRTDGIRRLLDLPVPPRVIILDDAMQHRYVKPGLTICLTSYNRIIYKDSLLPMGRLREPVENVKRADLLVVTKCPGALRSEEEVEINGNMPNRSPKILYSAYKYGMLINLSTGKPEKLDATTQVLIMTGIADPVVLENYVQTHYRLLDIMCFSDHHHFSNRDVREIHSRLDNVNVDGYCTNNSGRNSIIITTEKDASRLMDNPAVTPDLRKRIYYLPTEVYFLQNHAEIFDEVVLDYVNKPRQNGNITTGGVRADQTPDAELPAQE